MGDKRCIRKKTMTNTKRFLNMNELAEHIGMSKSFLYKRVCNKTIPFIKLGTRTVFVTEEIDKWVLRGGLMDLNLPELPRF
jgi:excisionase family DNA binding protein